MNKQLKRHYRTTEAALIELEANQEPSAAFHKQVESLYSYHLARVHDFQHERLIHLLVTLFFGILVIAALTGLFVTLTSPFSNSKQLSNLMALLVLILLVTELFYVRHYFQLENGVQQLYTLTERLQALR